MTWAAVEQFITMAVWLPLLAPVTYLCLRVLRKQHSAEIYVIWYINSFFFLMVYVLEVIASSRNVVISDLCGPYSSSCRAFYHYMTDVWGELELLVILFIVVIVPQLIAYLLSGISGTASPPRFVKTVQVFSLWSLVKFLAGLGGIVTAEYLASVTNYVLYLYEPRELTLVQVPNIKRLVLGCLITTLGFVTAAVYILATESSSRWLESKPRVLRPLSRIHAFLTRHKGVES